MANFRQTAQSIIPDDPEASAYRFIIVAAKRARQLQSGARSFLPTTSKKPTVVAMEEVRRGLVQYEDLAMLARKSAISRSRRVSLPRRIVRLVTTSCRVDCIDTGLCASASAEASPHIKRRSWPAP